jgi:hypothetical protein
MLGNSILATLQFELSAVWNTVVPQALSPPHPISKTVFNTVYAITVYALKCLLTHYIPWRLTSPGSRAQQFFFQVCATHSFILSIRSFIARLPVDLEI